LPFAFWPLFPLSFFPWLIDWLIHSFRFQSCSLQINFIQHKKTWRISSELKTDWAWWISLFG
jgi:hypothetical protein